MTKKVIIIDDNLVSLNIIKTAFAADNWETYGTQHANKGLEMVYDVAPDIIVTDAIMPVMGGFQLLKVLRNDKTTKKIPVIVYSVLDENNSKFYIKEERAEYYLKKNDNTEDLIMLANEVIKKHPVDEDSKVEILKTNINLENIVENEKIPAQEQPKKEPLDYNKLELKFKEKYDFTRSDEKNLSDIFAILYPVLNYELAYFCINSFEKNEKIVYFDIRDIILSPIFQNNILNEMQTKNSFLFKKYAPNLKVITNEEEFSSKIRFDFEYKENIIAHAVFYSKEKSKWQDEADIEVIRRLLEGYFTARYVNKSSKAPKANEILNKYFLDKLDFKFDTQNKNRLYSAIIEIANYRDLQENLASDEVDFINSRISEKLINFISDDEQVYKNEEDEYCLVFYAKDEQDALQKLGWVIDFIDEIRFEENKADILIGAADCKIDGQFNFYEAQKQAREALDSANNQNRIVIYGAK